MHVAFGRVRRKSRIGADYTDDADYRSGDGGRWLGVGNRSSLLQMNKKKAYYYAICTHFRDFSL